MKCSKIQIGNFIIAENAPVFFIAEIGINHNGSLERAKKLIKAAKQAGAHAVKFQSFKADMMCDMYLEETKDVKGLTGGSKSSYDMYKSLELSDDMHKELMETAKEEDILFFSSVFDEKTADFLDELNVPAYKIASSDLTHLPLIEHIAKKGKPLILSTGMGVLSEIQEALDVCYKAGNDKIIILHCVSSYPPAAKELNLNVIKTLKEQFPHPAGYSDHYEGYCACLTAVNIGASVIEKHFTLDNEWIGPDHRISLTAEQCKEFVEKLNLVQVMLGSNIKKPVQSELASIKPSRRSIRVLGSIKKGEIITYDKIVMLKPEKGLPPKYLSSIVGRKARMNMKNHEPITFDKIQ
ncbi:N-acetylneuraminate synthase family protein [bacterium]|nr:N-acetylneuraminate synthase family protein [bacterium]